MPHYNVKMRNGSWRVYSSVVDGFITDDMTFHELAEWRRAKYGDRGGATDDETASLLTCKPKCNVMDYMDAIEHATFMHNLACCPKCGCEDHCWRHEFDSDGYVKEVVACPECGISMSDGGIPEDYEEICARLCVRWNA